MLTKPDFHENKVILVFTKDKEKISFKNDNLIITTHEGKIKFQLSCYNLFALFIVGDITLTSGIISRSKKFGFSIILFTPGFKVYSTINFTIEGNFLLLVKQYTTTQCTEIAKQLIINKITKQKDFLKTLRNKEFKDSIKNLDQTIANLAANIFKN